MEGAGSGVPQLHIHCPWMGRATPPHLGWPRMAPCPQVNRSTTPITSKKRSTAEADRLSAPTLSRDRSAFGSEERVERWGRCEASARRGVRERSLREELHSKK